MLKHLRFNFLSTFDSNNSPKFSIITIVYNGQNEIESTILSVLNQDCKDYEYIIIDGNSSDDTLKIIDKYRSRIDLLISENDSGIYDAMNKGLLFCKGKWIHFLNCGDLFFNNYVLSNVSLELDNHDFSFIYGDCIIKNSSNSLTINKAKDFSYIKFGMPFCHQSVFVESQLIKNNLFDIQFKLAADYNFFYSLYRIGSYSYKKINKTISIYDTGGSSNSIKSFIEMLRIIKNYNNSFNYVTLFHKIRLIKFYCSGKLKFYYNKIIK